MTSRIRHSTVAWVNEDSFAHDVTSATFHKTASRWDFFTELSGGKSAQYTFETEGIYEYYCSIHGKSQMCGVVLVGDVSLDQPLPCERESEGY